LRAPHAPSRRGAAAYFPHALPPGSFAAAARFTREPCPRSSCPAFHSNRANAPRRHGPPPTRPQPNSIPDPDDDERPAAQSNRPAVYFVPAVGTYFSRYQGRFVTLNRHRHENNRPALLPGADATTLLRPRESFTLRIFSRDKGLARAPAHFSTQIEDNKLSPSQVKDVLAGGGRFPGRERDEAEVHEALKFAVAERARKGLLTERTVQTIHGLVLTGKKKATPYRDGQNVIRDGRTGAMVSLPPEAKDVPRLMKELVVWIEKEIRRDELPVPVIAGLVHYQFATIHPYFDGNGRTARLLTTHCTRNGSFRRRSLV
jgi:hypothetical protein